MLYLVYLSLYKKFSKKYLIKVYKKRKISFFKYYLINNTGTVEVLKSLSETEPI